MCRVCRPSPSSSPSCPLPLLTSLYHGRISSLAISVRMLAFHKFFQQPWTLNHNNKPQARIKMLYQSALYPATNIQSTTCHRGSREREVFESFASWDRSTRMPWLSTDFLLKGIGEIKNPREKDLGGLLKNKGTSLESLIGGLDSRFANAVV